ncbi:MAG TPA: beta-ketoacyl synthase N-terminal-like domain-containing protein [Bacteroidia bacterium]|nr:beta-ketoacyl synthase N-terminal-like domain-containing protein [Bacteroidia bacterium]
MNKAFLHNSNIISPLGFNTKQNFNAVCEGGVAMQNHVFNGVTYCAAVITSKLLDETFVQQTKSNPQEFTRLEKMCILSVQDVLNNSDIDTKSKRTLFIFSTTKGNIDLLENNTPQIPGDRIYLHETAQAISAYFGFLNKPLVVSNACISGLLAIIIAKRLIADNQYDNIIVTGADVVSTFTLSGFNSLGALSNKVCKPFDKNRTGINLGEAAASILISNQQQKDGVEIVSACSANDANHISGPSRTGEGLYKCLQKILADNVIPDFINAHGTATEFNDEMESIAFNRAGLQNTLANSLKGYYGHTLGAAGVLESIFCAESLRQNKIIASTGFENQGTSIELNIIKKTESKKNKTCLKTASGFGGCNAAVLYKLN